MSLLKFKCVECGNKISKINGIKDIFLPIRKGRVVTCKHCGCEYKLSKWLIEIADFYITIFIFIYPMAILYFATRFDRIADLFKVKLGGWALLMALILYLLIYFVSIVILPLKKFENKE